MLWRLQVFDKKGIFNLVKGVAEKQPLFLVATIAMHITKKMCL